MAYVYLIDLHAFVDNRLAEAREILSNNGNDPMTGRFEEGRIAVLADCKSFLTEQFNPRLPRRIRERYSDKKPVPD
ncbi:MAG: hypothetical protein JRF72_17300 [Deltaproteobacteria bacterium]|jgi:hypothetical protein|nr:hypothetical protein [Deltaproteobacteria bacterium]